MFGKKFQLNEQTIPVVEEIGSHMPGGFFLYRAQEPGELLYANRAVFDIFGCKDLGEFTELTGFTFRGMLHPDLLHRPELLGLQMQGQVDRPLAPFPEPSNQSVLSVQDISDPHFTPPSPPGASAGTYRSASY